MEINQNLKIMELKYQELRKTDSAETKSDLIFELRELVKEVQGLINAQPLNKKYLRERQKMEYVLIGCGKAEAELNPISDVSSSFEIVDVNENSDAAALKNAVYLLARKSIESKELQDDPELIEEIVQDMERNLDVMESLQHMVMREKKGLSTIEEDMDEALGNVQNAENELKNAADLHHKTMMMKLRMSVLGIFVALGYSIKGKFGMIMALFAGLTIFKS